MLAPTAAFTQQAEPQYKGETFWLPEQMSTVAPEVDGIFWYVMWVSIISFVGIVGVMVYFVIKYQRKPGDQPYMVSGPTHNTALEIWWSAIPLVLVAVMFFWGLRVYVDMATPPADAYTIDVRGYQWSWDFTYPNGMVTTNELHVVKGQDTRLRMTSSDVLHAMYIPSARVKMDVIPGRYSYVWLNAVRATGPAEAYKANDHTTPVDLFCAEYCGTQHSGMIGKMYVHETQEGFQKFLDTYGPEDSWAPEMAGLWYYQKSGCQTCHNRDESPSTGPGWGMTSKLLADGGVRRVKLEDGSMTEVKVDEAYIINSIKNPSEHYVMESHNGIPFRGAMSAFNFKTEKAYTDIVAFIRSIAAGNAPTELPK